MNQRSMGREYLFPYERVPMGSRVVIYGAGRVGLSFMRQLLWTEYAHIVCLMDRNFKGNEGFVAPIIRPQAISDEKYDYLIVALDQATDAVMVKETLIKQYSIPEQRIILGAERSFPLATHIHMHPAYSPKGEGLRVAFYLPGGLGDCIRARKPIIAMLRFLNSAPCETVIYGRNKDFLYAAYEDINIALVKADEERYREEAIDYDIALYVGYFWGVDSFRKERFAKLAPKLLEPLNKFCEWVYGYGLDPARVTDNGLHYALCRLRGWNAYTAFNMSGILEMDDKLPYLPKPMIKGGLRIAHYITLNVGWGVSGMSSCKLWPLQRWEVLIESIKREYPKVRVIQLGDMEAPRLKTVDEYYMGKSFSEVKSLLCSSLIHLDTDGGLVHLATHLGTKCAVLFGPTPIYYFGYPQNDNIQAGDCHNCLQLETAYWICSRRMEGPPCMEAISVDLVMEHLRKDLDMALARERHKLPTGNVGENWMEKTE